MEGATVETEYAFVADGMPTLDWSRVNVIIIRLKRSGHLPPVDLEDEQGNINRSVTSRQADQLADHLAEHGSEVVSNPDELLYRELSAYQARQRTARFVMNTMSWLRKSAHAGKEITVDELPADQIDITL